MMKIDYRKGGKKVRESYFAWRRETPWENHQVVSFVAGFNAALQSKKKKRIEPPSEPHQIVQCPVCGEAKKLEFHRSGDDQLYFKCPCGFESVELGPTPHWIK